jgi:hypothetical protein
MAIVAPIVITIGKKALKSAVMYIIAALCFMAI